MLVFKNTDIFPFVILVDGLLGIKADTTLKCLASRLATKWGQPYSRTSGYAHSRVSVTMVQAAH